MPDVFATDKGFGISTGVHYAFNHRYRIAIGFAGSGNSAQSSSGSFLIRAETEFASRRNYRRLNSKFTGFGQYFRIHAIYQDTAISLEEGITNDISYQQIEVSNQVWDLSYQHTEMGIGWLRIPTCKESSVYGYWIKSGYPACLEIPIQGGIAAGAFGTKVCMGRAFQNTSNIKKKTGRIKIEAKKIKSSFKVQKKLKIKSVPAEVTRGQPVFSYQSIRLITPVVQPVSRSYYPVSAHQIVVVVLMLVSLSRVLYVFGKRIFSRLRELFVRWKTKRSLT